MPANKFVLKHHQIEVEYTIGLTPGVPALIYEIWISKLPVALFTPAELAPKVQMEVLLSKLGIFCWESPICSRC